MAKSSGLGQLCVVPRVAASDADSEYLELDDLEFLGALQQQIETQDLPWRHVEFSPDDPNGELIDLHPEADVTEFLADLVTLVREHRDSVLAVIAAADDEQQDVAELAVSFDVGWTLDAAEYPSLIAWLNKPLDEPIITAELLREGTLDDSYEPPPALEATLTQWMTNRDPRHLALHAHAHALLADEPLSLDQPDDDTQVIAWSAGDGVLNAVLFRPADVPLLDILARAFDVPASVRESTYYLHFLDVDVELPDEPELSETEENTGMALSEYMAQMFLFLPSLDIPEPEDGEHSFIHGFHPSASIDQLSEAFVEARLRPVTMAEFLRRPSGEPLAELAKYRDSLDADDEDAAADLACFSYLLDGGKCPEVVPRSTVAALMWLVDSPASIADAAPRLEQLLVAGARVADE